MKRISLFVLFLFNFTFFITGEEKIKIAVLDFKILNVNVDIAEAVYEEFIVRLIDCGKFTVVERENLKKVMQEIDMQNKDEFDESSSVEIGKYVGAQVVLFGKIQKIGQKVRISIKGIDVKSATATFAKLVSVENEDLVLDNIPLLINQIIEETSGKEKKEEQKIINKEKQQKIEEINGKMNNLKDEMKTMKGQNIENKTKLTGSLAGTGVFWGLFAVSAIGTGVSFGMMNYYYDLNYKAETISMIDQYANNGSIAFWAGLGCSIGTVITLIPALALTGYYVYISGFDRSIDRKRKELQKLEIDIQKLSFFDIQINKDTVALAFSIQF